MSRFPKQAALLFFAGALLQPGAAKPGALPAPAGKEVDFAREIQPIFERSCLQCHGTEKPKSGFRLDNRQAALKGGDNGPAIIPGDSTNSALIQIVAGLHSDIDRMPPEGKGDPLTAEQISLLRAWIDQGAKWELSPSASVAPAVSVTPALRWITVSGDHQKFREHFGTKDGWQTGLEDFSLHDKLSPDSTIRLEGRLFPGDNDLRITLRYDKTGVGFIDAGIDQHSRYSDNSGGFFPTFQPSNFSLDRDLHMRLGRAWLDFGLALPDWPKLALGYEYQFRQGAKSTLQWGEAKSTTLPQLPEVAVQKNIYPAFKEVDENVHILKLDISHEFDGIYAEDNLRIEFHDLKTRRHNALAITAGQLAPTTSQIVDEGHHQFRAVNALRFEKEMRPWWFLSGGYLYSRADADATFRQNIIHGSGFPLPGDFWRSRAIILSQDSVLLNGNTRVGPSAGLTLSAGIQSEYMHQEGIGRVSLDTGNPATMLLVQPASLSANLDRHTLRETADLRFTGLPLTSLFASARLEQEALGNFENQTGAGHQFRRDTDSESDLKDWRAGFYTSPFHIVSLGGHYRRRDKHTRYDDDVDTTLGYPAFIHDRNIKTDEIEARLTWRPLRWLKTTFTWQLVETEFHSATDAITNTIPGGPLRAGTFEADVYGLGLILTPFPRWYFSGTFNYYDSLSTSADNNQGSVVPCRGDIYSALASATWTVNTNTSLTAAYSFSRADYAQRNFTAGLPLGIDYEWHTLQAGIARRFKNATLNLQYAFYRYTEPTGGGFNDYDAHALLAALTLRWP